MLLVNQSAFESWLQKANVNSGLRMQQLANPESLLGANQVSSLGEWFERLKSQAEGCEFQRSGSTAVINVQGALEYHYSLWSWYYDSDCYKGIAAKVRAAAADEDVERIVLNIHSPGGVHHGCPECAQAIYDARASKEVIAVVDFEAASAGYYIASQATRIIGLKSGWVGSIGTQILLYSKKKMYDEEGIDIEVIRAAVSPNKNLGISYEPISDAARAERQGWVDTCASDFVAAVAKGRGIEVDAVKENFGQGKMFFMPEAKRLGMVDGFGNLESVLAEKRKASSSTSKARSQQTQQPSAKDPRQLVDALAKAVAAGDAEAESALRKQTQTVDRSVDEAVDRLYL